MEISRLKLSGFKSFVEPAELRIEPGLTGVVGPNGCGKSNLLEAIRWVMGENSPKSMRSGGMEDVIFAGTSTRPPRAFAEVVLHATDDEGEELVVTRRIERGAGSAYRVNGRDVRAKDVALTFADAATGAHSPALVSQGKIAQVIAAKPAERRAMLEEAAGIAGLHVRRKDAESKLRQTEANLARLEDLMAGLDAQMNSLRRQAKQAERYKALSDEIATAEARLLFARWRDAARSAKEARAAAEGAESRVAEAQRAVAEAQKDQAAAARALAAARDELADRRDDASAHGHRMAALSEKLDAAEARLADLTRQRERLEADREDADRLTTDAVEALGRLSRELDASRAAVAGAEAARPEIARRAEEAERASRAAELALAKATADHAGVEAEWRVAEAAIQQAEARLSRLLAERDRLERTRAQLEGEQDTEAAAIAAREAAEEAAGEVARLRGRLEAEQARKADLQSARDDACAALATARAELAGVEREYTALARDRDAREKREKGRTGLPAALDRVSVAKGYERALAAVLGRDAKAPLGAPDARAEGRFWAGSKPPRPVADSLLAHVADCPAELTARLALVHVAEEDDGRDLAPGEWLVTTGGHLRRWDGFLARGEGSAEAARLEAANRLADLETRLPALRAAAEEAAAGETAAREELAALQTTLVGLERELAGSVETERQAWRALDAAEAAKERIAARLAELAQSEEDLSEQLTAAQGELETGRAKRAGLPAPDAGRAALEAARARNEAARAAVQATLAELAAHDQSLAVARERLAAQKSDHASWQTRSTDAARRMAEAAGRLEEIEQERAVHAARPAALIAEIEQGEMLRERLAKGLAEAEQAMERAQDAMGDIERVLAEATETLAQAREGRATLAARAENEEARRSEMARISGERFQCPPPLLADRFGFEEHGVRPASEESEALDRLVAQRERIGPVNLVAAEELARIEQEHGTSASEQAELAEAVARLRGSIGNLNREGRERLRAAFEEVDGHFRVLFTRLFQGGQAHLALVDSDDPLEAGLEIYAQPPGKRLQSLSLLSGGEQALTATALIFALFLTNPAPICVLDEVDAPLDDANVERFCDLLDSMVRTTRTRYLIVTHNAVTMSRMHRLFGVTMAEKGISRLVSVDLGEAEMMAAE
ncbi:chromosome segregation protein SMC [Erythrobacter sp. HL-111]|uniref:chromosome segregation protein SMC n=1 Tax=Erythrobacter sp. HL-111 TaxID=1798193 RepID=UPI0006DA15A9|nr:chromosome segregation protein SMC [Erythrobacter sp. HL-111]KPP86213.1 MAG: chromosome segregation protein Smc [Erythrobacteraceae bacterium HL-111]SDS21409.1 condensin subunit Smc [Erythrobacter sp. HL-111]